MDFSAYEQPYIDLKLWYFIKIDGYYHIIGEPINVYNFPDATIQEDNKVDYKPRISSYILDFCTDKGVAITKTGRVYRLFECKLDEKPTFDKVKELLLNDYCKKFNIDMSDVSLVGKFEIPTILYRVCKT
ncbi:hypothetical protein [Ochrobactrum sp. A-1]|uniref:hypothetical protein n=1 Tax=Ochrobactrum sp. A-1 TaxID=2920940 RepID=UPI001F0A1F8F|nr:hypothetical protein [Ochrobactrum sp. A-1]